MTSIIQDLKKQFQNSELILKFKKNYFYFVLLTILHLIIFWQHYFFDAGFPWDFNLISYGFPAFLTTAWSLGTFPQWMPFQSMGYPISMMPMDTFYPVYWLFSFFGIQYTMHIAVITQTIHILIGSFGMFLLLLGILKSSKLALVGAISFQFFGGFFSNAQHDNIIRAFSLAPWLFYVFYFEFKENKISKRIFFIPIIIFLLSTGSNFGNLISSIFIMSLFVLLQLIRHHYHGIKRKKLLFASVLIISLTLIGFSMSAVSLAPPFMYREYFVRAETIQDIPHKGLTEQLLPSLFLSSKFISGIDLSMTSAFVTLPILILASFLPISKLKEYLVFFIPLLIAILMVGGDKSPFYEFITNLIPALSLSRFPSSDYRVLLAIPIIVFGIISLKIILETKLSLKFIFVRSTFVCVWFTAGLSILYSNINDIQVMMAIFIMFLTILTIFFSSKLKTSINQSYIHEKNFSRTALIIFILLIGVNGFTVISDIPTWTVPSISQGYADKYVNLVENKKLITFGIFENLPTERPERETTASKSAFSWKGYLTGKYMMQDSIAGTILKPRAIVESNENYTQYMFMRWTPILLDFDSIEIINNNIILSEDTFTNIHTSDKNIIQQTYYGIDDITYNVSLKKPMLFIENEMYFPGWTAIIKSLDEETKIKALSTNNVFRSWILPAGDYELHAYFEFPYMLIFKTISVISFVMWTLIIVFYKINHQKITK